MTEIYLHCLFAHYGLYGNAPQWAYETDDHGDGVRATAYVSGIGWGLRLRGGGLVLNMEDGVSMTMDRDGREVLPAYAHDLSVLHRV